MKHGVKIIECLDADDPGSEGHCLKHIFNLMEIDSSYSHVDSIDGLLSAITKSKFQYIHISTHGVIGDTDRFKGWWTPNGIGKPEKVRKLSGKLEEKTIISTACKSGVTGFGRFVVEQLGCQHYIGPTKSPNFYNASFFSHIFYHKLFMTKGSVRSAFKSYEKQYRNPHGFTLY